jgi:hypothetical protein
LLFISFFSSNFRPLLLNFLFLFISSFISSLLHSPSLAPFYLFSWQSHWPVLSIDEACNTFDEKSHKWNKHEFSGAIVRWRYTFSFLTIPLKKTAISLFHFLMPRQQPASLLFGSNTIRLLKSLCCYRNTTNWTLLQFT